MNSIFGEQYKLLRKEIEHGKSQLRTIEKNIKGNQNTSVEQKTQKCIWEMYFYSIRNFWDHFAFTAKHIAKGEDSFFQYYVGNIRTLIEIYANIIFIYKEPVNVKVAAFAGHHLKFLSDTLINYKYGEDLKDTANDQDLENKYQKVLVQLQDILSAQQLVFPNTIQGFALGRPGIPKYSPDMEKILKEGLHHGYLKEVSVKTYKIFKSKAEQEILWTYWSFYSMYIHRQFINTTQGSLRNEKFWSIPALHLLAFSMIELTSLILSESIDLEFANYEKELTSGSYKRFIDAWNEKSQTIT